VVGDRKAFLAVAGTALAGGVLAACGSSDDESGGIATETGNEESTASSADVAILNQALATEQRAVAAYQAAAEHLSGALRKTAQDYEAIERQHADALSKAILALGATPETARDRYALPSLDSDAAVLRFTMGIEQIAVAQYLDLIPKLSSANLRGAFASILTVEAQQLSVLREEAGQEPAPDAFVGGKGT
jgi:rubrerythrin